MNKIIKLLGLCCGLSSVLCMTMILFKNYPVVVGLVRFYPESNSLIRYSEIGIGIFTIIILIMIIREEINR